MSTSAASDLDTTRPSRGGATKKLAIVAVKLLVTAACFWFLSRRVDTGQVLSAVRVLDFRWAAFATAVVVCRFHSWGCGGLASLTSWRRAASA
jgi:hypothetical protein